MARTTTTSLVALGLIAVGAAAQHGHPLVGSWSGDWTRADRSRERMLLVLEYEDDEISGSVFFGTRRVPLASARLDPGTWTLRAEAVDTQTDGERIEYSIEGSIENLGSTTERTIAGTITSDDERGAFRVVMN